MDYKLGLIGFPIKHSLSPWIHEQFLMKTKTKGTYSIFEIPPHHSFADKMAELKKERINGFNVTVPYKEKIIAYLDELDEQASHIGAVNTVLYQDGKWVGYNTDGIGYVRSLEKKYPSLLTNKDKRILLLGAGGAARGIYFALVSQGFNTIDIANRTVEKAQKIAKLRREDTMTKTLTLNEAEHNIADYDVIIQTTSVGMKPKQEEMIISLHGIKPTTIVSDIVYQPIKTAFLQHAETLGASIHFGHTMLLYQAQYAFEIWTNKQVTIDDLDEKLQLILEG